VAEIAKVIWVAAGAAKASEVVAIAITRTREAFAQNLLTKEDTKE
jgi:hypothetical protein